MTDTHTSLGARRALDRFERRFLAAARDAGVKVMVRERGHLIDDFRDTDYVLLARRELGQNDCLMLERWDGLLLSAWVHVTQLEADADWFYLLHLSRHRGDEVPDDKRLCSDGKDGGDLEWILQLVVAWLIELRDLWEAPIPQPGNTVR